MSFWTLVIRSLAQTPRNHLGVFLGSVVGAAILVGALVVGDSVRASLERFGRERLGTTEVAVTGGDRLFRKDLAKELAEETGRSAAPALRVEGLVRGGDAGTAHGVQVLGVDPNFWQLAESGEPLVVPDLEDAAVVNQRLADYLGLEIGDRIRVQAAKPSALSREAPISPQEGQSATLRVTVGAVAAPDQMGRFSLLANQVPPFNVFLPIGTLQEALETGDRANLILVGQDSDSDGEGTDSTLEIEEALSRRFTLDDAELHLRPLEGHDVWDLSSTRVFLNPGTVDAAREAAESTTEYLTYLVTTIRGQGRETPYSMITAGTDDRTGGPLSNDGIAVTSWLADDLGVTIGDAVELEYLAPGEDSRLVSRNASFVVERILPFEGAVIDRDLMPPFPGVEAAENARDWDTGFPIDLDRIRQIDEEYWDAYKGAPKAFVSLEKGSELWGNRFGERTSIRFNRDGNSNLPEMLLQSLDPAALGVIALPVRDQAKKASAESFDFGQLFLGFSSFLIAAALALIGLLFQFGIERRHNEIGLLLALGFPAKRIRRLLLCEGAGIAFAGGLVGIVLGQWYAQWMLNGLGSVWRDAVGTSSLMLAASPGTLLTGGLASTLIATSVIWWNTRSCARQPANSLLSRQGGADPANPHPQQSKKGWLTAPRLSLFASVGALGLALASLGLQGPEAAGAFFGAGALALAGGVSAFAWRLRLLAQRRSTTFSRKELSLGAISRRAKRSVTVVACLACAAFLVIGVEPFRLDANLEAGERDSGTGGFELYGESAIGVVEDLNEQEGREFYALDDSAMETVQVTAMRLKEGEDASCLNLNRVQRPQVLGVPVSRLADLGAFAFSTQIDKELKNAGLEPGWELLDYQFDDPNVIAGVADIQTVMWALGTKIGGDLEYIDERGEPFRIRLVGGMDGSVLQGAIMIAEDRFKERFPGVSGHRRFFVDAESPEEAREALAFAMEGVGLNIDLTVNRLNALNQVQNTYLSTFQALGGLGLILGSVGLAVIVLRNVLERRGELAALRAIGYPQKLLRQMVTAEHSALLALGLALGVIAALVALIPTLKGAEGFSPWPLLGVGLGTLASGILWTVLATRFALRGRSLDALSEG